MHARYAEHTQALINGVLNSTGETALALRHAIKEQSAKLGGHTSYAAQFPHTLDGYVTKVALHAYKITDQDIEALHAAGYSENAIFELTLSAALGAGIARLERGLQALKGDIDASQNS